MTRRNEFPASVKREALERSNGICECHLIPHVFKLACGLPLGTGNTFFEHINPDEIRKDNSLENCAALSKTCWRYKTDHHDLPIIAKAKRNFDSNNGIHRWRQRLPGGRFDPIKKKMNGLVVDRKTGLPWQGSQ
jgi:hypothetical protein